MPSINDIVEIARALEEKPVLVIQEKCAGVRNRHTSCTKCIDACPADCIVVDRNKLRLDFEACVGCQACCTACPTGALMPLDPMDADLARQVADAIEHTPGLAAIACARIASKHVGDPRRFAEVPCVCRVDESLLLAASAHGARDVVLVDGVCKTCKYRATQATTDAVVENANTLLAAWGAEARVRRASEFPPECVLDEETAKSLRGEDRRNFFGRASQDARRTAVVAAEHTLHLEQDEVRPTLREMLKINDDTGALPHFDPQRQMAIVDALDAQGTAQAGSVRTRTWGNVTIDEERCNACGMCVMFCPTGAMSKAPDEEAAEFGCDVMHVYLQADCTQCRLCYDSCFRKCITLTDEVDPAAIDAYEPRVFFLKQPKKKTPFGSFGGR